MCSNYTPGRKDRNEAHFGLEFDLAAFHPRIFTGAFAPIIKPDFESGQNVVINACFGMVPHWAEPTLARHTYNARSETVAVKPSFRNAWKRKQFCIVTAGIDL